MTRSGHAWARFQTGSPGGAGAPGAVELTRPSLGPGVRPRAVRPRPGHRPEPRDVLERPLQGPVPSLRVTGGHGVLQPVSGYSRATAHAPAGVCSNSVKAVTWNSADRSASPL